MCGVMARWFRPATKVRRLQVRAGLGFVVMASGVPRVGSTGGRQSAGVVHWTSFGLLPGGTSTYDPSGL